METQEVQLEYGERPVETSIIGNTEFVVWALFETGERFVVRTFKVETNMTHAVKFFEEIFEKYPVPADITPNNVVKKLRQAYLEQYT